MLCGHFLRTFFCGHALRTFLRSFSAGIFCDHFADISCGFFILKIIHVLSLH
ncbi:unnamed protein product [Meloidogyne enterolobii]|uniref:Uncharacterized protein n=1 Tax=Meloidogyne enterolobii TaxID=390850 RepID=A0ACB0Z5W9_MELEN